MKGKKKEVMYQSIVRRGDGLGKSANIKFENKGVVVYAGSSLTVHNPLFFVQKLTKNIIAMFLFVSKFKMI